jgi:hypothetical protein
MPFYLYFIRLYYIFLTALAILAPLDYDIIHFMPALLMMWIGYFVFKKGADSIKISGELTDNYGPGPSIDPLIDSCFNYFVIFCLIFLPLSSKFYTGTYSWNTLSTFTSSVGQESNYYVYQSYFDDNNLRELTLQKLLYIILNGFCKALFWYFCIYYYSFNQNINKKRILGLAILYFLFFLQGVARGTSFENFELLVISVFSVLVSRKMKFHSDKYSRSQLLILGMLIFIGAFYFIYSASLRYEVDRGLTGPTSTLRYDPDSWIMHVAPGIGEMTLRLSGYFTFGLYHFSEIFWKIYSSNFDWFCTAIVPFSAQSVFNNKIFNDILRSLGVDPGACWQSDTTSFCYDLGIPLYLVCLYFLGKYAQRQYIYGIYYKNIGHVLLLFVITYEFLALPVGNFMIASSANKISLVIFIYLTVFNKFQRFLQK